MSARSSSPDLSQWTVADVRAALAALGCTEAGGSKMRTPGGRTVVVGSPGMRPRDRVILNGLTVIKRVLGEEGLRFDMRAWTRSKGLRATVAALVKKQEGDDWIALHNQAVEAGLLDPEPEPPAAPAQEAVMERKQEKLSVVPAPGHGSSIPTFTTEEKRRWLLKLESAREKDDLDYASVVQELVRMGVTVAVIRQWPEELRREEENAKRAAAEAARLAEEERRRLEPGKVALEQIDALRAQLARVEAKLDKLVAVWTK